MKQTLGKFSLFRANELAYDSMLLHTAGKPAVSSDFDSVLQSTLYFAFYAILANIPFWIACKLLGIWCHGWFCLEYVVIGLVGLFIPGFLTALLLIFVTAADVLCGISNTYYMVPSQCLVGAHSLILFPKERIFSIIVVIAVTLFGSVSSRQFSFVGPEKSVSSYRFRTAICLLLFAAMVILHDFAIMASTSGHILSLVKPDLRSDGTYTALRLWRPTTLRLFRSESDYLNLRTIKDAGHVTSLATTTPSAAYLGIAASDIFHTGLAANTPLKLAPNFVLVLVESWGVNNNLSVQQSILKPYLQPNLLNHYQVIQGTVPFFNGGTIAGESRELCQNSLSARIAYASKLDLANCLPHRLSSLGYQTIGLHAMDGHFYDRKNWWPQVGLNEIWFRDKLRQQGLPDCEGAYIGTCDSSIAQWLQRRLNRHEEASSSTQSTGPQFIYWVTLNSHLPVPSPNTNIGSPSCSFDSHLSQQASLCSWFQIISKLHHSVAQLAMSNLARPTVFVLVGDHAPPFYSSELRNQFSSSVVPYIILIPRELNTQHR